MGPWKAKLIGDRKTSTTQKSHPSSFSDDGPPTTSRSTTSPSKTTWPAPTDTPSTSSTPLSTLAHEKILPESDELVPSDDRPSMSLLSDESTRLSGSSAPVLEKLPSETLRPSPSASLTRS